MKLSDKQKQRIPEVLRQARQDTELRGSWRPYDGVLGICRELAHHGLLVEAGYAPFQGTVIYAITDKGRAALQDMERE